MFLVYKSSNFQGILRLFATRLFFLHKSLHSKQNDFNNKNVLNGYIYIRKPCDEKEIYLYSVTACAGPSVLRLFSLDKLYSDPTHCIPFVAGRCWVQPQTFNLT